MALFQDGVVALVSVRSRMVWPWKDMHKPEMFTVRGVSSYSLLTDTIILLLLKA